LKGLRKEFAGATLLIAQIERTLAMASKFHKVKYLKNQSFAYTSGEIVVSLLAFPMRLKYFPK